MLARPNSFKGGEVPMAYFKPLSYFMALAIFMIAQSANMDPLRLCR